MRTPDSVRCIAVLAVVLTAAGCEPSPTGQTDAPMHAPVLRSARLSPPIIDTDSILVGPERLPNDLVPVVVTVRAELPLTEPGNRSIVFTHTTEDIAGTSYGVAGGMRDDGVAPDSAGADGTYAGRLTITIPRSLVGTLSFRVQVQNDAGFSSQQFVLPLRIVRLNLPPVLSGLIADTLLSSAGPDSLATISIAAADPNGAADILRVWFDSYLPSGSPSSQNPILMFDSGNMAQHGDQNAGDGRYSTRIFYRGAPPGTYRFEFRAYDRSRDTSNAVVHMLTIVP